VAKLVRPDAAAGHIQSLGKTAMKKINKGNRKKNTDPRNLSVRVAEIEKQVKIARDKAHRAKVDYKQARKEFKQAKKAAKQARKMAKVAARELKPAAKKKSQKTTKPPIRQSKKRVATAPRRRPSAPKAVIQTPSPATPQL